MGGRNMKIGEYSDNYQIIASGSFLLKSKDSNAKVHIDLRPEYKFWMDLVWTFKTDDLVEDAKVKLGEVNDNLVELVIINAHGFLGNGTQEPTRLTGFTDGKSLYCNYFFSRPTKENPRLLTYTLYMES